MNPTIYNAALVIHIVGITIMAGTTFLGFFTFGIFRALEAKISKTLILQ